MRLKPQSGEVVTLIIIVIVVLGMILGGYKLVGVAADAIAERIPDSMEADLFSGLGETQATWTDDAKSPDRQRAQRIFDDLKKMQGLRDLPYRLRFIGESEPNAFAMPGGTLAVTDGILDLVESDIGLATVIAHEFGHMQERHSLKMMGRSLIVAGGLMLIVGDPGLLLGLALNLAEKSHSRDQELEADAYGLRMVHLTFGTTEGSLEFFTKIAERSEGSNAKVLSMLSTHPYTPDRIEQLKRLATELETEQTPSAPQKP